MADDDRIYMAAPYCTDPRFDPNDTVAYIDASTFTKNWDAETWQRFAQQVREKGKPLGGGLVAEIDGRFLFVEASNGD